MEIITLGIGTPSSIPTFILMGLEPNPGGTPPAGIVRGSLILLGVGG
jgi:hypothetical protein